MPVLELKAKLGVDGRGFRAGLKEAEAIGSRFAGSLKTQLAAAFSVAAAASFLKNLADTVGRVKDLADQYSITTDEVQRADVALRKNGLQFENLGHSIQRIGAARRDAVEGNKELRDTFERYGITLKDLNDPQRRNYDLILQIARAIRGQNLTAREQVELTDLLGARSLKLITTLQTLQDFDGIKIFEQEDIQLIDDANKKLEEMQRRLQVLAASGIVEGSRNPGRLVADTLSGLAPTAPVPAALNLIGRVFAKLQDKFSDSGSGPIDPLEVVKANIEKSNRIGAAQSQSGLFDVDKDVKRGGGFGGGFRIQPPTGFAQGGGVSNSFLSAFDPRMQVAQQQLKELSQIKTNTGNISGKLDKLTGSRNPFR